MLVLISYDVNTETAEGKRRLRKVAKQCVNYGQRVQNSVFECVVDTTKLIEVKAKLLDLIDEKKTVFDFIIWAITIKIKSSILERSRHMKRTRHLFFEDLTKVFEMVIAASNAFLYLKRKSKSKKM